MHTEHLLPSTRITAAVIAGRITKDRARRIGVGDRVAHGLACLAAGLTRRVSIEMARDIALARAQSEQETSHV